MKKHIMVYQLEELSPQARERLRVWFDGTYEFDDDNVLVFIPEEKHSEASAGVFTGMWDTEHEFEYPELYIGKLKNHQGAILPLMDITLMWQFLEDHNRPHPQQTCDELWEAVKRLLEE